MARLIDATRIEQYILNNCSDNEEINAIYAEIINAPTVDAEPVRHGRWETVFMSEATGYDPTLANYNDPVFCRRCSVCKEDARLDEFGEEILSKYCPNCGARCDL